MSELITRSQRELENAALSRRAAAESMVLLHNKGALPLEKGGRIALYGLGAARTVRGGVGSGDPFNGGLSGGGDPMADLSPRYHIQLSEAFRQAGYEIVTEGLLSELAELCDGLRTEKVRDVFATFACYEPELEGERVRREAELCSTAVYVLSRNAGEGYDRTMKRTITVDGREHEVGDYLWSASELTNLALLRASYAKLIVVLNVGAPVDMTAALEIAPDAVLLMNQPGQEAGAAVLDVLCGDVNPSGRLTATWAKRYSDYPAAASFGDNDGDSAREVYSEGIYAGYRWFDGFDVKPLYEFGYGLSYTTFEIAYAGAELDEGGLRLRARVRNTGAVAGREVAELYVSKPESELEMPVQELAAYAKTGLIPAGVVEEVELYAPLERFAAYSEAHGGYIISRGEYIFRLGTSSRSTLPVCRVSVDETALMERVLPVLAPVESFSELSRRGGDSYAPAGDADATPLLALKAGTIQTRDLRSPYRDGEAVTYTTDSAYKARLDYERVVCLPAETPDFRAVRQGRQSPEAFIAQLSEEELAALCCGYGWGIRADEAPKVKNGLADPVGAASETTHELEGYGVPSIITSDGPAGLRLAQRFEAEDETGAKVACERWSTAWPCGTMLAQSFDTELLRAVGEGMSRELCEFGVEVVLGPGMNLQRDPLCGRNFEYFSEDPLVTGLSAAAIVGGVQTLPGRSACIKHFACNDQEASRIGSDSVVGQRALRELYLRGFRLAIELGRPYCIMTSYNRINSVATADSRELCMDFARAECGFDGLIMTDWVFDRAESDRRPDELPTSHPAASMRAGNDIRMPGGPCHRAEIASAVREGRIARGDVQACAARVLDVIRRLRDAAER